MTGRVTAGWLALAGTAGLMVTGEADLATDGAGAEVEGGAGWAFVAAMDLLGAGLIGGTVMDDIITTGGEEVAAGTVLTTTVALVLAGSRQGEIVYVSELVYFFI